MNRRVFVTGGAHGIGRSIVDAFSKVGDRVAFCDINEELGNVVAQKYSAKFFEVDVRNKERLENCINALLKEWGDIDIIINNVGISKFSPITETTVEDFEDIINVNLRSVFITSRLIAKHRSRIGNTNNYGRIVNLCSTRYLQSEEGSEAYAASKGGIWSMTHALAVSLAQYNITVNCIAPGVIQTDMLNGIDEEIIEGLRNTTQKDGLSREPHKKIRDNIKDNGSPY